MPAFQLVILVTPLTGALELIASLRATLAKYTDGTAMRVNEIHNSVHQYLARILC